MVAPTSVEAADGSARSEARVLVAIIVYGGRDVVADCVRSTAHLSSDRVDVLVLDDCSPDETWSGEVRSLCHTLGVGYYRSPRNLGIPRNMNLGLLKAMSDGYDYVLIANSDIVVPGNLVERLVATAEAADDVGSVTAWSNSVSRFSIPNDDPAAISDPAIVEWLSSQMAETFGTRSLDIPTAVGFCMLLPVPVVRRVGLFDPVYGRGYCEEVDWCQRSKAMGLRALLAPSVFVYHVGQVSTLSAGMVAAQQTSVRENDRIIDMRYPSYAADRQAFDDSGAFEELLAEATEALILAAARRWGYSLEASWFPPSASASLVRFLVEPEGGEPVLAGYFAGFRASVSLDGDDVPGTLERVTGRRPDHLRVQDRGRQADRLLAMAGEGVPLLDRSSYPQRL